MLVVCRKSIDCITKEDLGMSSPWLKVNQEYVVVAVSFGPQMVASIYIQTEQYNEPRFSPIDGFEILDQTIPSSWITVVREVYGHKVMTLLPASWNYDSFFEDID